MEQIGKIKRLNRIFSHSSGRIVIVPLDDSLLAGPSNGLENLKVKTEKIIAGAPNAIIGFQGLLRNFASSIGGMPSILNITASTTKSIHTRKVLVGSVELALRLGAEAVAVHVNISSKYESEMLKILGEISLECERFGMPLLGIMYPRKENEDYTDNNYYDLKKNDVKKYTELVAHAARVGVELGSDIIKTQYTGDPESFKLVVDACNPIPIIIAGGSPISITEMLRNAEGVVKAGGAGISYGRNIFTRQNPVPYIEAVKEIIHNNKSVEEAEFFFNNLTNKK